MFGAKFGEMVTFWRPSNRLGDQFGDIGIFEKLRESNFLEVNVSLLIPLRSFARGLSVSRQLACDSLRS